MKRIKVTHSQAKKLAEGIVEPSNVDGWVEKGDHSALVHHYHKADDAGKASILNTVKSHQKGGEVTANKIIARHRDYKKTLEETNGVIDGIKNANDERIADLVENTGEYSGKHFADNKHGKGKTAFYTKGQIVDMAMTEDDLSDGKPMPDFTAKPVNECLTPAAIEKLKEQKAKQADDSGVDELGGSGGVASDGGGMDEQEEISEIIDNNVDDAIEETTTSASSGQYSSKYFIAGKGKEKDHLQYPGGSVVKVNPKTHDSGVNSFTTKRKLKESLLEKETIDLGALKAAARKIKHCGDYGILWLKGSDVCWTGGDADTEDEYTSPEEIEEILKVPGVTSVEWHGESYPSEEDGFTEIDFTSKSLFENLGESQIPELSLEEEGYNFPESLDEPEVDEATYFKSIKPYDNITSRNDDFAHYHQKKRARKGVSEDDATFTQNSSDVEGATDFNEVPTDDTIDPNAPAQFTTNDLINVIKDVVNDVGEDHPVAEQLMQLIMKHGNQDNPDAPVAPELVQAFREALPDDDGIDNQETNSPAPVAQPQEVTEDFSGGNTLRDADFIQLWQTIDPSKIKYGQGGMGTNLMYGNTPISVQFDRGGKTVHVGDKVFVINDKTYEQTLYPVLNAIQGQNPNAMGVQRGSGEGFGRSKSWWESKPTQVAEDGIESYANNHDGYLNDEVLDEILQGIAKKGKISSHDMENVADYLDIPLEIVINKVSSDYGYNYGEVDETTGAMGGAGQFSKPLEEGGEQQITSSYIESNMADFIDSQGLLRDAFGEENVHIEKQSHQGHCAFVRANNGDEFKIGLLKDGRFYVKMNDDSYDNYNVLDSLQEVISAVQSFNSEQGEQDMSIQEEYNKPSTAMSFLKKVHQATANITNDENKKAGDVVKQGQKTSGVQFVGKVEDTPQIADQKKDGKIFDESTVQDEIDMIPKGMEDLKYANPETPLFKKHFEDGLNPVIKSKEVTDQFGNKYPAEDHANVIDSGLGEKLIDDVKKKKEAAAKQPEAANFIQRTQVVKEEENMVDSDDVLRETEEVVITKEEQQKINEDVEKMKKLLGYTPKNYISTKGNTTNNSLFKK